jgi:hypothetical protein
MSQVSQQLRIYLSLLTVFDLCHLRNMRMSNWVRFDRPRLSVVQEFDVD